MYTRSEDSGSQPQPPEPRPLLALAAAAVERAFTLVAEGNVTLKTIRAAQAAKGPLINAEENPGTGRRSSNTVAFSEELWGGHVDDYLANISKISTTDFNRILTKAREFIPGNKRTGSSHSIAAQPQINRRSSRANIALNFDDNDADDEEDIQSDAVTDDVVMDDALVDQDMDYN